MANIQAIEKSVMTTADEKMLKQMAESMPFEIYQQLSPEARGRLAGVYGKSLPLRKTDTSLGELPLKKQKEKIKLYVRMGPMHTVAGMHSYISVFEVPESDLESERHFFEYNLGLKTSLKTPDWGRGKLQEEL